MMSAWKSIACKDSELALNLTLACGQSFRWRETKPGEWTSVLAGRVWTLTQTQTELKYKVYENGSEIGNTFLPQKSNKKSKDNVTCNGDFMSNQEILRDYFRLDINLSDLYKIWSSKDSHFKETARNFTGVRMLRQDPVENLFSFICSSNNHISRISGMVERLCERYGENVGEVEGQTYYSFPSVEALAGEDVEETLRKLGFGYRAKYINKAAQYIIENHSPAWLYELRQRPHSEAKAELMKLCGVGAKVADCVCLMSLDKLEAIPVDTHVWQIATRDYKVAKLANTKTLTDATYKQIGDFFQDLWGDYAGWAHSVLFSADLKKFQDRKIQDGEVTKLPTGEKGTRKRLKNESDQEKVKQRKKQ